MDQSGMLAVTNRLLYTPERFLSVVRARRFGKSDAADLVGSYYTSLDDSTELFEDLKIAEEPDWKEHMNRYVVISMGGWSMMYEAEHRRRSSGKVLVGEYARNEVVEKLQKRFPDGSDWSGSLGKILGDLNRNRPEHPEFVVVMDEWEAIFREEDAAREQKQSWIRFLRELFVENPDSDCIAFAFLTAVLPMARFGLEKRLPTFTESTMLEPGELAPFLGFS